MSQAQAPPRDSRFLELDGLRGIAVVSVMLFHYTTLFDQFFPGHPRFPVTFQSGSMGVQLFFMISGYVIFMTARRHRTPGAFARARGVRLYPTYWACVTVTIIAVYASGTDQLYRTTRELTVTYSMLQSFVNVRSIDGAYWSLSREIIFYGIVGLGLWAFRGQLPRRFVEPLVWIWPSAGLAICLLDRWSDTRWSHLLVTATASQYAALFCIGLLMFETRQQERSFPPVVILLGIEASIAEGVMDRWELAAVVAFLVPCFVLVALRPRTGFLRNKVLVWLGSISYPLYLLHQDVGYVIMDHTVGTVGRYWTRVLAIAGSIVLAWLVHELVETRLTRVIRRHVRLGRRLPEVAHA